MRWLNLSSHLIDRFARTGNNGYSLKQDLGGRERDNDVYSK